MPVSTKHRYQQVEHARDPINLYKMMERLGVDPGRGVIPQLSLRYATALHRCEACQFKDACRDWLDQAPSKVTLAPHFCPDADILFELQFDQRR